MYRYGGSWIPDDVVDLYNDQMGGTQSGSSTVLVAQERSELAGRARPAHHKWY